MNLFNSKEVGFELFVSVDLKSVSKITKNKNTTVFIDASLRHGILVFLEKFGGGGA